MAWRATDEPAEDDEACSLSEPAEAWELRADCRCWVCWAVCAAAARESGESCLIDEAPVPAPDTTGITEEVAASVSCAAGATERFAAGSWGEIAVSAVAGGSSS